MCLYMYIYVYIPSLIYNPVHSGRLTKGIKCFPINLGFFITYISLYPCQVGLSQ